MRPMAGLVLMLALALVMTSCARLDIFKRRDSFALGNGPRVGSPAPDIDAEDFEGKRFKLSDHRGKVVVLTFWASWCKYCLDQIPHERELVERYRDRPFALLGVNNDDNRDAALKVIASRQINWRNWQTGYTDGPINHHWGVKAWPTVYVIDANGIIRATRVSGSRLEQTIDTLLAEIKAPHTK